MLSYNNSLTVFKSIYARRLVFKYFTIQINCISLKLAFIYSEIVVHFFSFSLRDFVIGCPNITRRLISGVGHWNNWILLTQKTNYIFFMWKIRLTKVTKMHSIFCLWNVLLTKKRPAKFCIEYSYLKLNEICFVFKPRLSIILSNAPLNGFKFNSID